MHPTRNLITDVPGVLVGNADDARLASGVTAIVFEAPAVGSIDVRGGGPGTRETALLDPAQTVQGIDAIALAGGSAFGLDAASGVQAWLAEQGRGFAVGDGAGADRARRDPVRSAQRRRQGLGPLPALPRAGLRGGQRGGRRFRPGQRRGRARGHDGEPQGRPGLRLRRLRRLHGRRAGGGQCRGQRRRRRRAVVLGGAVRAAEEFGGRGFPSPLPAGALAPVTKGSPRASTTLAVVATDATLTKAEANRLAIMAQDGLARALYPIHTPLDGDVVFAVATGRKPAPAPLLGLTALGTVAANCLARAVARGVYEATALPFPGALPAWRDRFGPAGGRSGAAGAQP